MKYFHIFYVFRSTYVFSPFNNFVFTCPSPDCATGGSGHEQQSLITSKPAVFLCAQRKDVTTAFSQVRFCFLKMCASLG